MVEIDDSGIFTPPSRKEEGRPGQTYIFGGNALKPLDPKSCGRRCVKGHSQGVGSYLPGGKIQYFYTLTIEGSGSLTLGGQGGIGMSAVLGGTGCYKDATGVIRFDVSTDSEDNFIYTYDMSDVNVN